MPTSFKPTNFAKTFGVFSLLMFTPTLAHAGAWTAPKGDVYLKGAVNYFETSSRFGPDDLGGFENFRDLNFNVYLEYGLQDNLTFFTTTSLKDIENTANGVTTSNSGIADVDLGLRYNLSSGPTVISVQGLFKAPFLYSADSDLPLGNGQVDLEGKLLIGRSFGSAGYIGLEAGYRYRAEDPVDEFRYLVEYGVDLTKKTYFRTKLDGTLGLGDADADALLIGAANPSLPLAFDLGKLEYTLGHKLTKTLAAEITGTTNIYGDNTLRGTNIQFAIVAIF